MLSHITAFCNFAASWIENTEVINFFKTFLPPTKIPSHHKLTQKIIPVTNQVLHSVAQAAAKGQMMMLQGGDFMGINNHHLLTFMITADGKVCVASLSVSFDLQQYMKFYTIHVEDVSEE